MVDRAMQLRQSPLESVTHRFHADSDYDLIGLDELAFVTQIGLRGNSGRKGFRDAVQKALGAELPTASCTASYGDEVSILWLGPDEWLAVSQTHSPDALVARLEDALGKQQAAVIDLSANRTIIELRGENVRNVLEKGCMLDLHPRAFSVGRVVGTIIAQTQVFLEKTADQPDTFRLYVRCSFARHLADWLLDAKAEFSAT